MVVKVILETQGPKIRDWLWVCGPSRSVIDLGGNRQVACEDKARGHKGDRGVLTCTLKNPLADNAVYAGESAVSHSAVAE
jgi:hypothetical protein